MNLETLRENAQFVETSEIPENRIIDVSLSEFLNPQGQVFYIQDTKFFLKQGTNGWLRYGKNPNPLISTANLELIVHRLDHIEAEIVVLKGAFEALKIALEKAKSYIDIKVREVQGGFKERDDNQEDNL